MKKNNKGLVIACKLVLGVTLTVGGIILIPPMIQKYANKLSKTTAKTSNIDFDNFGPEIVKEKNTEDEEK